MRHQQAYHRNISLNEDQSSSPRLAQMKLHVCAQELAALGVLGMCEVRYPRLKVGTIEGEIREALLEPTRNLERYTYYGHLCLIFSLFDL